MTPTRAARTQIISRPALVIDIIDSKSYKLLKRGYATRPTLKNLPDDAKAARIQEVVDEILRELRVAP